MKTLTEIRGYTELDYPALKAMLEECFLQDYKIELTLQQLEAVCNEMTQQVSAGIQFLDLLILDGAVKGFINYQVDSPASDWCEKENWGCIREAFVAADARKKGCGKMLVAQAERKLTGLDVPNIYLTTDDSKDFWTKAGYHDTGEICAKNGGKIFVKFVGGL